MTSRDFCYWLQGYFEIHSVAQRTSLTDEQVRVVQKHLNLVFIHEIDPSAGPQEHQDKLNAVHNGMTPEQVAELKARLNALNSAAYSAAVKFFNERIASDPSIMEMYENLYRESVKKFLEPGGQAKLAEKMAERLASAFESRY